jgi:hypothetical protein
MSTIINGLKNYKTTLVSLATALLTAYKSGAFDGQTGPGLYAAIGIAAIGFLSHDAH